MKSLIRLVLVLVLGVALGYFFRPTIDLKIAEKASPEMQAKIKERQKEWNNKLEVAWNKEIETDSTTQK